MIAAGSLETVKLVSDVASNVVTIAGVLIGAGWAYWAFVRERTRWPKANLELAMSHRTLTSDQTLLHIKVKVHNAGRGLMKLNELRVDVRQVLPLTDETAQELQGGSLIATDRGRARWRTSAENQHICRWGAGQPLPAEPEIEPGENDEFGNDFVVPSTLETVYVYVYLKNVARKGRDLGWTVTSYYDVAGSEGDGSAKNVIGGEAA